ncbi:MAG TPA: hypothetical protein DGG94_15440 [Micromonosporaceae bacterium]|nr:hypothetical protein [Micromonosporaceae bacterium]HCU51165.1 hypothetical protein [Micromonosporaceae bacterium]
MRSLRVLSALLFATFALAGCMKVEMNLTVNGEQDTINGSMIFAMDKAVLTMNGKSPEEAFAGTANEIKELPKGSRSEVYDDGKFYGRRIIFENMTFEEFNRAEPGAPRFTHQDGKYTFGMDADMSNADLGPQSAVIKPILDTIELKIAVTFPGKVIERDNLAELSGNTVSWKLKMGSAHKLNAVAEEPATFQWLLVAGVGGLFGILVVVGIVVLAIRLNRRPKQPAEPIGTPVEGPVV